MYTIRQKIPHEEIIKALKNIENDRIVERHNKYKDGADEGKIELYADYIFNNYLSYFLDEDITIEEEDSNKREEPVQEVQEEDTTVQQTTVIEDDTTTTSTSNASNSNVAEQTTTVQQNTPVIVEEQEKTEYDDFINSQKEAILMAGKDILSLGKFFLTYGFKDGKMKFTRLDPRYTIEVKYLDEETNQTETYAYYTKVTRNEYYDGAFSDIDYIYVYALEGIYIYTQNGLPGSTTLNKEYAKVAEYPYFVTKKGEESNEGAISFDNFTWSRIPVITSDEINFFDKVYPFIKEIIDIQETGVRLYNDLPDSFIMIKNYSGTDSEELRTELNEKRIVKVDGTGDMRAIVLPTESSAYETFMSDIQERLWKLLGMPVIQNFGNASGVALKYIYKQLELCTNFLEPILENLVTDMVWAYQDYAENHEHSMFTVIFNTTIIEDDKEKIENIMLSRNFLRDEDLIKLHPYYDIKYTTVEKELPVDVYSTNIDFSNFREDDLEDGATEGHTKPILEGDRVRAKVRKSI